tara:strand:+ start:414 stop:1577 length:1164 start_codon:yes stop_codon:yes gene_type:complete
VTVTDVGGFEATGVAIGIKSNGELDMALVVTADRKPVTAAGVFTSNKMTAAPVLVSRKHLESTGGLASAVIINSGNANAATGKKGVIDAEKMCDLTAEGLGCASEEILVCSTGWIGFPLPMDLVAEGIKTTVASLGGLDGETAARAIMTTDTVPKNTFIKGEGFSVGGIAKGAAMLQPNMATMLSVLTTDAIVEADVATKLLKKAVSISFNCLTVDGAESTNDTVLLLANGTSGVNDPDALAKALNAACKDLAIQMADDAEGSTKTVFLTITGAKNDLEAEKAARSTANCQLIKCSWYGEDPYWGRIAAQIGSAGVSFDPMTISVSYGNQLVYAEGEIQILDSDTLTEHMAGRQIKLHVDLGQGGGEAEIVTTDLTHAYIDENMRTS